MKYKTILILTIAVLTATLSFAIDGQLVQAPFTFPTDTQSLENGAHLYQQNCAQCHGKYGYGADCFDENGRQIDCKSYRLRFDQLLCEETSSKLTEGNFSSAIDMAIYRSIAIEHQENQNSNTRLGTQSAKEITTFVASWANGKCGCESMTVNAESLGLSVESKWWPDNVEDYFSLAIQERCFDMRESSNEHIALGDAGIGKELYIQFGCKGCHGTLDTPESAVIGPWLGKIDEIENVPIEGMSLAQYIYRSILEPNEHISKTCPKEEHCIIPSPMPANYGARLLEVNFYAMADLLTYLLNP